LHLCQFILCACYMRDDLSLRRQLSVLGSSETAMVRVT
jgi:hypothetical protein